MPSAGVGLGDRALAWIVASDNGWWEAYHTHIWGRQAAHFLNNHATHIEAVPVPLNTPVLEIEAAPLYVASGWR